MRLLPVLAVLALLAPAARAQAPITIVVNFAAGGSADRMARLLAPELGEALGTQVVVKTTTGAAGAIGHFPRDLGADGAVPTERVLRDAEELCLGGVRVRDRAADEVVARRILREFLSDQATGARFGNRQPPAA